MSNRRINDLASILGVLWAGFYVQAIVVNSQANCTISTQAPSCPDDEDQSAVANDDLDQSSDDPILLRGTLSWLTSVAAVGADQGRATIIGSLQLSTSATLESQHILLRL